MHGAENDRADRRAFDPAIRGDQPVGGSSSVRMPYFAGE